MVYIFAVCFLLHLSQKAHWWAISNYTNDFGVRLGESLLNIHIYYIFY